MVLRLVNRGSLAHAELRDSIADWGVLTTVLVRPSTRFPGKYDVAYGLYRTSCRPRGRAVGALPGEGFDHDDLLAIQIQANALRPETTPMCYARQIKRIIEVNPDMKEYELVASFTRVRT